MPRPLELKRYYVLLALASGPLHAWGVHQQAIEDSSQSLYLSPTTLVRLLKQLERRGFVDVVGRHQAGSQDIPIYALALSGRRLLRSSSCILTTAAALSTARGC